MIDLDLAQATFEYILRKKRSEGKLPVDKSYIMSNEHYYVVDWQSVSSYDLWNKLIDESFITTLEEKELDKLFSDVIDTFIANIVVADPKDFETKKKLSDLSKWEIVKSIPKKYFKM